MKNKKWIAVVLFMVLCLALQACGRNSAPSMRLIGSKWTVKEMENSSFTIEEAKVAGSYTTESGETLMPDAGDHFLVLSCNVSFAEGVKVDSMRLTYSEGGFTAEWPQGPYETGSRTVYIFRVPQNLLPDETVLTAGKFCLNVNLRMGETACGEDFSLQKR